MIYFGGEKENHGGNRVKYFYNNQWYEEGTLIEPVKYQIINTKEHGLVILSTSSVYYPEENQYKEAIDNVSSGNYTHDDLKILKQNLNGAGPEVASVMIINIEI